MQNELTPEAAIVELNRCKVNGYTPTDWDRRCKAVEIGKQAINRCMIRRKLVENVEGGLECSVCGTTIDVCPNFEEHFCFNCGQALDWGDV